MLIHNLKNRDSLSKSYLVYLLKGDFYCELITSNYDFTDPEVLNNYGAMVKGITVNLPTDLLVMYTIQTGFSLIEAASSFMNDSDLMIRTAARSAFLSILNTGNEEINQYIVSSNTFPNYFASFMDKLRELDMELSADCHSQSCASNVSAIALSIEYITDVLDSKQEVVADYVFEYLINNIVLPVILGSIFSQKAKPYFVSIKLAWFILVSIYRDSKVYPKFQTKLRGILVSSTVKNDILMKCYSRNPPVHSFSTLVNIEVPNKISRCIIGFLGTKDDSLLGLTLQLFIELLKEPGDDLYIEDKVIQDLLDSKFSTLVKELVSTFLVSLSKTQTYLSGIINMAVNAQKKYLEYIKTHKIPYNDLLSWFQDGQSRVESFRYRGRLRCSQCLVLGYHSDCNTNDEYELISSSDYELAHPEDYGDIIVKSIVISLFIYKSLVTMIKIDPEQELVIIAEEGPNDIYQVHERLNTETKLTKQCRIKSDGLYREYSIVYDKNHLLLGIPDKNELYSVIITGIFPLNHVELFVHPKCESSRDILLSCSENENTCLINMYFNDGVQGESAIRELKAYKSAFKHIQLQKLQKLIEELNLTNI